MGRREASHTVAPILTGFLTDVHYLFRVITRRLMSVRSTPGPVVSARGHRIDVELDVRLIDLSILPAVADDTNPKRQRGRKSSPRLRFGLVWNVSSLAAVV